MKYQVETIEQFEKEIKKLKKKFPSLKSELLNLVGDLEINPKIGTSIGKGFFKIWLAIKSKGKGKRGGARVITYFKVVDNIIYLVSIYDKSEKSDISSEKLMLIFENIPK
ncbi:type II toxin-antitoxin system RelE/ParE family toxin [Aquiflexum sp. TKW24L]|uniref:type II toxin-antitoxin system RelE/ParE family toxin n=1 Tax=Aquiflexum sp. TKW24L TaxID=2942212 RepID=UPI0020C0A172|nr:type II toxin-antitoxin system RelE/ParE family toxin [Aquiflexum sp. TKW24L]MCL6259429.1 type II toxin-antitoxin system RelE/ParE family toxin [Aquiflexum sp. TKW24L]